MSKQQLQTYNFCQDTIKLRQKLEIGFLELGGRLHEIKEKQLYLNSWECFEDYLVELKMSQPTASRLINIFKVFVLQYRFEHLQLAQVGGWSLLAEILPFATSKAEAEVWVSKAALLSQTDLRRELKEAKTGLSMADCKHKDCYQISICSDCGLRTRVYDQEE